jgi:drug/metabolite transporter (DMT)-like permease
VYWSETRLPSGLVSVLWAVFPMLQATLGHFTLPGERLSASQLAGFVLGFLGVASLFATDLRALGPGALPAGSLVLVAPLVSAFGTTAVKRFGGGTSSLALNRDAMWIGAALLGALAFALEREAEFTWDRGAFLSLAYLSLCGTVLTFGIYFWLLRHVAASKLAVIAYVTPAIALALGAWLNDEPLTAWTLAGFGGIVAGVFLVHQGARRRPAPPVTAPVAARLDPRAAPPPRS